MRLMLVIIDCSLSTFSLTWMKHNMCFLNQKITKTNSFLQFLCIFLDPLHVQFSSNCLAAEFFICLFVFLFLVVLFTRLVLALQKLIYLIFVVSVEVLLLLLQIMIWPVGGLKFDISFVDIIIDFLSIFISKCSLWCETLKHVMYIGFVGTSIVIVIGYECCSGGYIQKVGKFCDMLLSSLIKKSSLSYFV